MTSQAMAAANVNLFVAHPSGQRTTHELQAGKTLIVGSGRNCGLHLPSESVSAMHCLLSLVDGQLRVQDWCSASGTHVNGAAISDETPAPAGSEIRIGEYLIHVQPGGAGRGGPVPESASEAGGKSTAKTALEETPRGEPRAELTGEEPPETAASQDAGGLADDPSDALGDTAGDEAQQRRRDREAELAKFDEVADSTEADSEDGHPWDEFTAADRAPSGASQQGPVRPIFDDAGYVETIELLKAEVELLQSELAERDARLQELTQLAETTVVPVDASTQEDESRDAALLDRLESLLDELQSSDDQTAQLEHALRLSEEARAAEQEERRQIESWLGDIEKRVALWEAERKAEHDLLRKQLDDRAQECRQLEQRLQRVGGGRDRQTTNELERLSAKNERLRQMLEEADCERVKIQQQLKARTETPSAYSAADEQSLRQERLQLAQERAALARQQAELANLQAELERKAGERGGAEATLSDQRLRALRDHLKEIHEQEKEQKSQQGFSARIARLWQQLDR